MESSHSLEKLKEAILTLLENNNVKVLLFGSRARVNFASTSDVDVGIIPKNGFDRKRLTLLREHVEELNISYKVEIVDFQTAGTCCERIPSPHLCLPNQHHV